VARHPKFFGVELQGAIGEKGRFANLPLAGLFPSQLFAARSIEMPQVFPHEFPHYGSGNGFVIVAEHVADAGYLRPGDTRVLGFELIGHTTAGLGYDFDTAFNHPLSLLIGFEGVELHVS
jgi:hypothetical protein